MKKCIICGKNKQDSEFNEEHIVPEALGNKTLKFDEVCMKCNSNLGTKIDTYITSGFFMELVRYNYKVAGKDNILPFPFKEGIDEYGNKVRLDNNFKPVVVTSVDEKNNRYNIKTYSKENAIKIVEKKYKRGKLNLNQKNEFINNIENTEMTITNPTLSYKFKINFIEIELAILKIAYEYSYLKLGNTYYDDKCGSEIRKIIQNAINNNKIEKCNLIYHLPNELREKINALGKEVNNSHFFQMKAVNNKIVLTISLFCDIALSYMINISDNADRYDNTDFIEFIETKKI